MFNKQQLAQIPEYWMEDLQNKIYFELKQYMQKNNLTQNELAGELGFSKGYISQVLHGKFNHSLKKLIQLSIAIGKVPEINFKNIEEYSGKEKDQHKADLV